MSNRLRRSLVLSITAGMLLAFPAGSSAAVYCVEMGGACPAGGTASATLTAAMNSAKAAADEDWIYLGATTHTLGSYTSDGSYPVHVVGSGRDATTVNATSDAFLSTALDLSGSGSSIERLTLNHVSASGNGTALSLGGGTGIVRAVDLRIVGDHYGVLMQNRGQLVGSDVRVPMSGPNVAAIRTFAGVPGLGGGSIAASTLRGAVGVLVNRWSTMSVDQTRVTYGTTGISADATSPASNQVNTAVVHVSDSVLAVEAQGVGSTFAFSAFADTDAGGAAADDLSIISRIDVRRTTVSGLGGGAGIDTVAFASSDGQDVLAGGASHVSRASIDLSGVAVVGAFDLSVYRAETPDAGGNDATSSVNITDSNIDLSPARQSTAGTVSGNLSPPANTATVFWRTDLALVDPANGDFRPTRTSPLVDAAGVVGAGGLDAGGGLRPVSVPASATPRFDIGAFEYQWSAPSVTATGPTGAVVAGGAAALSATATDADPGETAQLTYAWAFPGGGVASGPTVTTTAPTAPGLYVATVTVTDPVGVKTSVPVSFAVVAAPVPLAVVPADKLAPMAQFGKLKASLAKLVKRKAAAFRLELSEAATVRATAVVTVRQPAAKRGGKPKLVKVSVATSVPTELGAGVGAMKLTASKVGAAKLLKALKVRGAKVASATIVGTITDASGNKRAFSTPVTITK